MRTIMEIKQILANARVPYPHILMDELEETQGEVERLDKELSDAILMINHLAEDKKNLLSRGTLKDSIIETLTKQKLEETSKSAGAIIERDWYKNELEKVQNTANKSLELSLLEMWHSQGIEEIYKYKNRIKVYRREGLIRYELFTDITCGLLFKDVEDTANYRDATPEDYKVRVDVLLNDRREELEETIPADQYFKFVGPDGEVSGLFRSNDEQKIEDQRQKMKFATITLAEISKDEFFQLAKEMDI
ncbi:hypothetical protein ABIE27_005059 [Paenibacillus sp. 4624]|uniref:hypothetical protein n=1 Tax=Paenibacillus sp. 4624 TaxID=3156453 RepID=UPI003D1C73A7